MKRETIPAAVLAVFLALSPRAAADPEISGVLETSAQAAAGAGGADSFSGGFEEYSNVRLKASVGERGTVHAAVNLMAAAGQTAQYAALLSAASGSAPLPVTSFVAGENYAAALELERLYFRVDYGGLDVDAGLFRLAFGYGQAFRPMDFLSPPNPLLPDARPRGVLGAAASVYPSDTSRIKVFAVSGANPFATDGGGAMVGAAADVHGVKASLEGLYAFEAPSGGHGRGVHYAGLAAKLEAGAGIVLDALYAIDPDTWAGPDGLQASLGVDYSFGDFYVVAQYLYNGPGALDPEEDLSSLYSSPAWFKTAPLTRTYADGVEAAELYRKNYVYAAARYAFDDYTSSTLSVVSSLDDLSFSPALTVEHEPFQGMAVSLTCRVPLDARSFSSGGEYGELGPVNTGARASVTLKAKLRF